MRNMKSRNEQILDILNHFGDETPNSVEMLNYCGEQNFEPIPVSEYQDFVIQKQNDADSKALFKDILGELQNLAYIPVFTTSEEEKELVAGNDEVEVNIARHIEKYNLPYNVIHKTFTNMGKEIEGHFRNAENRVMNSLQDTLTAVAKAHLGEDFHSGHLKTYWESQVEKPTDEE